MKGSRIDRTVGKRPGTLHGQDRGKPIIDKKTGALLGYKRSFLYQNKLEPEQDRQWLLKKFYLNDVVTGTYPNVEHTKDFVLCRLQRKKRAGSERQEIKDVPVEIILRILLEEQDILASVLQEFVQPVLQESVQPVLQGSVQWENNNGADDDMDLMFDLDILFDDPELLAIQQRLEDVGNYIDNREGLTEGILQEPAGSLGATINADQGGGYLLY
nr:NAC domain-containing protein 41-like [Ipomoea batatas]